MKGFGKTNNLNEFNKNKKIILDNKKITLENKLKLAKNLLSKGKSQHAKAIYSQLLKDGNKSYELLFSYALLSRNIMNFDQAKKLLFQSISQFPSKVDSYILLAEIFKLEKNFEKSEELLLTARKINPRNSNTYYNLALLYREIDSKDIALNNINQAIKLLPENYIYKLLKAEINITFNNFDESRSILRNLLINEKIIDKKHIMLMLSTVERKDKKFKVAEKILLDIISDTKSFSEAYLNLSDLYFENNKPAEAKEILIEGINFNSNMPQLYVNLAIVCRSLGQLKDSIENHLMAISLNKNLFQSYENLSDIYDFSKSSSELKYLMNVSFNNLNRVDIYRICFARGNIFHKRKNFKEASNNYKLANDIKRKLYLSNKDDLLKKGFKIKKNYFNNLSPHKLSKNENKELIFIVGMPRSGSTLLENILSLNENVTDLGEIDYLSQSVSENSINIDTKNPYENYLKLLNNALPNIKISTDKNLFNYKYCPVIKKYFKNSKIIFCMRNPLDNILSIYRTNFTKLPFTSDLKDITELYIHHIDLMKIYTDSFSDIIYNYYYDDLVNNPSKEIKKIIAWLGWEWSDKYLSPHKNSRSIFTASSEQVRNPIHNSSLGGWKNYQELLKPAIELISNNKDLKKYLK